MLLKERSLQKALTQLTSVKEENKRLNYELSKLRRKHSHEIQIEREKVFTEALNFHIFPAFGLTIMCIYSDIALNASILVRRITIN